MSKLYTKHLDHSLSPAEIEAVFANARRYFIAAQSIEGVEMPEPLMYTDTSITFAYIDNLARTVSELWFADRAWDEKLCRRLGAVLGALHIVQGIDLSEDIYLYGDYVPHNVVYREDELVLFDVEPPGYRQSFEQFYRGRNYVDIASMLFFVLVGHSYKRPWRFFRNKRSFVQAYLSGYEEASGFNIDKKELKIYLKKQIAFWYFDRGQQHEWLVKNIKYCFVRVVLFVQWYIYRIV